MQVFSFGDIEVNSRLTARARLAAGPHPEPPPASGGEAEFPAESEFAAGGDSSEIETTTEVVPYLVIRRTNKGRSVFAARRFYRGEPVTWFRGKLYSKAEYFARLKPERCEFLQIDDDLYIGPARSADNYVNHSCHPNTRVRIFEGTALLVAVRDIPPGEEISFDYSTTMDEDHWEMDCCCGSRACRGRVRDFKHLPEALQRKYLEREMVLPFIARKYAHLKYHAERKD